jgi:nicotinamidase-related amidase
MQNKFTQIDSRDAIVLFLDLQAGIIELTKTNEQPRLRKSVEALGKLARLFDLPVIVSAVREQGKEAVMIPEIENAIGAYEIHYRTTCDCFANAEIQNLIHDSGRKTILISGVATELAVQLPALSASAAGYQVFVVIDACGGITDRTESAALGRIKSAGGLATSVITLAGEIAGDLRNQKAVQAVGILFQVAAG